MTDLRSKNGSQNRQFQIKVNEGVDMCPPIQRPPKKPKITRVPLKTLNCCPNYLEQVQLIYKFIQRKEGFTYLGSNGSSLQGSLTWGSFAKIFAVLKMMLQGVERDCDENLPTNNNINNGRITNDDINDRNNGCSINTNCNKNYENISQNINGQSSLKYCSNVAKNQQNQHFNACMNTQSNICNGNYANNCFNTNYATKNINSVVTNEDQELHHYQGQGQGGCLNYGQGQGQGLYLRQGQGLCQGQGQGQRLCQGQGQGLCQGQGQGQRQSVNQGYYQRVCGRLQQGQDFYSLFGHGQQKPIFIDLGCGSGLALFYAHISNMFSKCIGVDLMDLKSTFQLGKQLMSKIAYNNQNLLQNWESIQACFNMDILNLNSFDDILGKDKNNKQKNVPIVVFISDTAFTDEVRWHVYEMVKKDKRVAAIITFKGRSRLSIFSARAIREALSDHFLQGMVKINEDEVDELTVQLHGSLEGLKAYIYMRKELLIEKGIINENECVKNCVTFAGFRNQ
eukprot:TRINITY_DN2349_c0_g1_i1.p1 TRINITY_DN2349_c0_g1~~TRINITY_DN2349_c0_g1_i1.p1  ORF type:complete len:581 (+),score=51.24 TRINITY_DN2349_c0_g1_i1:217-1743(+)